jgi:hypothetical protein
VTVAERPRAELLADGGAAARSDDLFRSPAYLAAEGTTHTLRLTDGERTALVPLILRSIEGSERTDAISPYGYPGGLTSGGDPAIDPAELDWSETGLVSVFVRDRVGEPALAGGRERSRVLVHDPGRERSVRARLAEQIRAAEREGWAVERSAGPTTAEDDLEAFVVAYTETMRRTGAAERYFFEPGYFRAALAFEHSWLLVARGPDGRLGAGAIAATSDGFLHYFLGGTAESSLAASPFKNVVVGMLDLADELGLPLNLGGGVAPDDGLERFKRGFANADLPFHTHEIICDPEEYERLAASRDPGGFFPAYRAQ